MHSVNWESYSFMRVGYVVGGGGQFVTTVHFVQQLGSPLVAD